MKTVLMAVYNEIDHDGRVERSAEALADRFEVTVISKHSGYNYSNDSFNNLRIKTPPFFPEAISFLIFNMFFFIKTLMMRPDLLYLHDFHVLLAGRLAASMGIRNVIYDAHELIFPSTIEDEELKDWIWYFFEVLIISRADLIIAANDFRAERMQKHYRLSDSPEVIRNITKPPGNTIPEEALLERHEVLRQVEDKFTLVYQGNIYSDPHGLPCFIKALTQLDNTYSIVIAGDGNGVPEIEKIIKEKRLEDRVLYLGRIPRNDLEGLLNFCSAGIICYPWDRLNRIYCAPNKLYEYTNADMPIISSCQPPLKETIIEYEIGELYGCGREDNNLKKLQGEIEEGIKKLTKNMDVYKSNLRDFLNDHNWVSEKEKLQSLCDELFKNDGRQNFV